MRPETESKKLLKITRSKAKMYEYDSPAAHHIQLYKNPANLFPLAIGMLGELPASINRIDDIEEISSHLDDRVWLFPAHFFNAYLEARLEEDLDPYLSLVCASSYYLSGLPGSSIVLVRKIGDVCPDLSAGKLEELLFWLLRNKLTDGITLSRGPYIELVTDIYEKTTDYFSTGEHAAAIFSALDNLRVAAYTDGTARELLFADTICAVIRKKYINSTWYCLPKYSELPVEAWAPVIQKETFITELWPSQQLLGQNNLYGGQSAIVQMPTSAGKTKSTEIIIRSSFLSGRAKLAIIVAPFRALCHEIRDTLRVAFKDEDISVDELSDVLQADFEIEGIISSKQILVVTPEKLLYVIRKTPELVSRIGLMIYDEAHQFDSGKRGITYELLLSSLKKLIPTEVQTILISAVISNAQKVSDWLLEDEGKVVAGTNLFPTERSVAFSSFKDSRGRTVRLGQLQFIDPENIEGSEGFVPRVLEQKNLTLRGRERNPRHFPETGNSSSIALYLGLKLVKNGAIAVFCGQKASVSKICRNAVDIHSRGYPFPNLPSYSDEGETSKLYELYKNNLGENADPTKAAKLGILSHHGAIPNGIKLAVEYALQENLASFVVCTSTLAQGVNLPIRYLIVTSTYQAGDEIKVRDFQNLIGRAGRSGKHTEGTVIFSDPGLYDERSTYSGVRKWQKVSNLLNQDNSEPCASSLLSILSPLANRFGEPIQEVDIQSFIDSYVDGDDALEAFYEEVIAEADIDEYYTEQAILNQLEFKKGIFASIENYLMALVPEEELTSEDYMIELIESTLAYFLGTDDEKNELKAVFLSLAENIKTKAPDAEKRSMYGKTLFGLDRSIEIEEWLSSNKDELVNCVEQVLLLTTLFPLLKENITSEKFHKCENEDVIIEIAEQWVSGQSYGDILEALLERDVRFRFGTQLRSPTIDFVVDICDQALSFEGSLIIGALIEMLDSEDEEDEDIDDLIENLLVLQKSIKYGLPTLKEISLYEIGFSDRHIAMEISEELENEFTSNTAAKEQIRLYNEDVSEIITNYPAYYSEVFREVL